MLDCFKPYPFEKLRVLLDNSKPPTNTQIYTLTIGEPQFETPQNIIKSWQKHASLLNKYPKSSGEDELKDAQLHFIKTRYNLHLSREQIIPTFGTREVLFNFPQFYLFDIKSPHIAYPNPFYQIYEGATFASKAQAILMNLTLENHFKPSLSKDELERVNLVILNSPNNPTGCILELDELSKWVELALKYDFVILNDECYSEIYENTPPPSILQASINVGNTTFRNILAINSISKRSSAPGLRSGFIAGDSMILERYNLYRTYLSCTLPLPLQKAATTAWNDNKSTESTRIIYARNLSLAREILNLTQDEVSPYTFYVWLKVGSENSDDDEKFCKFAYEKKGILVLPGSYLGRNGMGKGYVRIALVYDNDTTQKALLALKDALDSYKQHKE